MSIIHCHFKEWPLISSVGAIYSLASSCLLMELILKKKERKMDDTDSPRVKAN